LIDRAYITEWQQSAPWPQRYQVEQDLIICRALVEIFNHPLLAEQLAFRGGTALFKLHLPPARYSEDIDLVQVQAGPIGPVMDAIQEKLNSWLGIPKRKQSDGRVTLTYRLESEEGLPLKLKVEINSREHFSVLGFDRRQFSVESRWFSGSTTILTYHLDELLGTKVRALEPTVMAVVRAICNSRMYKEVYLHSAGQQHKYEGRMPVCFAKAHS